MYLYPFSVLLLCKYYMYLPACAAFPCAFSQCLQNASFSGSIFFCVRRLLQEYKIHTLITWYFLKQFCWGENFYKSEKRKKLDMVLIKSNCSISVRIYRSFYGIIFVGIVIIFCIADWFGWLYICIKRKFSFFKLIVFIFKSLSSFVQI